ncbi:MAG: mycofactocin-coupled SDR family oxidoreductase [Actinobacteria bacterium]|nr:mycofactocin-coupled SDR family oxidoreductase [Actinomycetota bacterium]
MSGRVEGKVAFITGAARGQGRSHAVRLAEEGADIIAMDLCAQVDTVGYAMATPADLDETVAAVEALDRRIVAEIGDVRDLAMLEGLVARGVEELGGRLDIVSANAGITGAHGSADVTPERWQNMIDINLTGVWHTIKASLPSMEAAGNGGAIVLTSSYAGANGVPNLVGYAAAKHGVVGLMHTLAQELAEKYIRVNTINPGNCATDLLLNDELYRLFRPDLEDPTYEDVRETFESLPAMNIPYIESIDASNALLFLASDEARYITGIQLPIDGGWAVSS